jgi:hypothetical protein
VTYGWSPTPGFAASPDGRRDAIAATGWTAERTREPGADPGRLLVAGDGTGAALAAAVVFQFFWAFMPEAADALGNAGAFAYQTAQGGPGLCAARSS